MLGAGDGNRTHVTSLEGSGNSHYTTPATADIEAISALTKPMVEGEGFEPSKPRRQIYNLMGLTAPQPLLGRWRIIYKRHIAVNAFFVFFKQPRLAS